MLCVIRTFQPAGAVDLRLEPAHRDRALQHQQPAAEGQGEARGGQAALDALSLRLDGGHGVSLAGKGKTLQGARLLACSE